MDAVVISYIWLIVASISIAVNIHISIKYTALKRNFSEYIDRERKMGDMRMQTLSMIESQKNYLRRQNYLLRNKNWVLNRDSKRDKYLAQLKVQIKKRNARYDLKKEPDYIRIGMIHGNEKTSNGRWAFNRTDRNPTPWEGQNPVSTDSLSGWQSR